MQMLTTLKINNFQHKNFFYFHFILHNGSIISIMLLKQQKNYITLVKTINNNITFPKKNLEKTELN